MDWDAMRDGEVSGGMNKNQTIYLVDYAGGALREHVTTYEWRPVDPSGKTYNVMIKIKIYRSSEHRYDAVPSHKVKTAAQLRPYLSLATQDTAESAVRECIRGMKMYMREAAETEWPLNEEFAD